jgi:hypothetical protein
MPSPDRLLHELNHAYGAGYLIGVGASKSRHSFPFRRITKAAYNDQCKQGMIAARVGVP